MEKICFNENECSKCEKQGKCQYIIKNERRFNMRQFRTDKQIEKKIKKTVDEMIQQVQKNSLHWKYDPSTSDKAKEILNNFVKWLKE